jgi:hypothetical protein
MSKYYTDTRYVVIWNEGKQSETFKGPDASKRSSLHQNTLRDAGYSSQRYERQWVEMNIPRGWVKGNGSEPVDATEPKKSAIETIPDTRLFEIGTKVEDSERVLGVVTEVYPSIAEVQVRWAGGYHSTEHVEKLRLVETTSTK